jgi:predicted acyltransferase
MGDDLKTHGGGKVFDKRDPQPAARRIASVDALRGLTILVMIFVNDLGPAAPSWMHHIQPPNADGMTLADVVFPIFLFIVGVSIPLAFERAQSAGKSTAVQLLHILTRTAGLLLMGVIVLNAEQGPPRLGPLWNVLAFIAIILAWTIVPPEPRRKRAPLLGLKALGIAGLLVLLAIYRNEPGEAELALWGRVDGWVWLRTGWWGILGLIGWAYLTVGLLVLLLGWRREWLMGALALLMVLHLAFNHGGLTTHLESKPWLGPAAALLARLTDCVEALGRYVSLRDALGSLAAITMAGCVLGTILRRDSDVTTPRAKIRWALTFAAGLFVAGCLTDTFEGINKNAATPTWCFWSSAVACVVWVLLYLLLDVARRPGWGLVVRPAGANPLVAYFLHPIAVELLALVGLADTMLAYKQSANPWVVVGGSLVMALIVCAAAGALGRWGLRMRL